MLITGNKFLVRKIQLIKGMNRSLTREVVILPNAPATITPTAMSRTLPRIMNVLNSSNIFFIIGFSFLLLVYVRAELASARFDIAAIPKLLLFDNFDAAQILTQNLGNHDGAVSTLILLYDGD